MLQEFREQHLIWDKANRRIHESVKANASDAKGRKLTVQVLNDGVVEDLTGTNLSLYWETRSKQNKGLDAFDMVDASQGIFELYYTTGMLSNEGKLRANLVLVDNLGKIVSDAFVIEVSPGIDDDAVESSDSFTALTKALVDVQNLEQNYAPRLNEVTAQLAQMAVNVKKFGVVGDGITDDSTKIQQAINHAKSEGLNVYFPPGDYYGAFYFTGNTRFIGAGKDLTTLIPKEGATLIGGNAIGAVGLVSDYIKGVSIEHMTFDTTHGRPYFKYIDGLTVHDIRFNNSAGIRLDSCINFDISNIEINDATLGIGFMTASKGTIRNVITMNCAEPIDFYNTDFVVVDNIRAETTDEQLLDEIIDIGACKDLTITNVIGKGFRNGLTIKNEQTGHALENIIIDNFTLIDHTDKAIEILYKAASHMPSTPNKSITLTNLHIESTVQGSRGVLIDNQSSSYNPFDHILISDSLIKVDLAPIGVQVTTPGNKLDGQLKIHDSILESFSFYGLQLINAPNTKVHNTDIKGADNSMSLWAKLCAGLTLTNCYIHDSNVAVSIEDSNGIVLTHNTIENIGSHAVQILLKNEIESYANLLTFFDNKLKGFGLSSAYKLGLNITSSIASGTSVPIEGVVVRGNRFDGGTLNNQTGLAFATNDVPFDNVFIKDNTVLNVNNFYGSATTNNIHATNRVITDNLE